MPLMPVPFEGNKEARTDLGEDFVFAKPDSAKSDFL